MKSLLTMGVVAAAMAAATLDAQAQAPAQSGGAMVLSAADLQQMAAAYPGLNAGVKSIDAGAHVIDFWLARIPARRRGRECDRHRPL